MSCSKRGRKVLEMRDGGSLDRISSLPDELLGHILSFFSTCNAVRTSILSTRWRYLFTLTSNLSFDDTECKNIWEIRSARRREELKMSFEKFVYGVLALHKVSPIQKFTLRLVYSGTCKYDSSHLRVWITAAILKEVRHLNLRISYVPNALPNCVFNSQTLVKLVVNSHGCNFRVPGIVRLPSLRTLELHYITFSDGDSVDRFFVGCSQLKELSLYRCQLTNDLVRVSAKALEKLTAAFCEGNAEIDVPNLANLSYICSSSDVDVVDVPLSLKNYCSISSVELRFRYSSTKFDPTQAVLDLITIARNARELSLMWNSPKLLPRVEHSQIPTYTNQLKSLHLGGCCPDTWKYVAVWLANAAQLETLVFHWGLIEYTDDNEYEWVPNLSLAPFSSNIKTIEVHSFKGNKLELQLLKYLLENAGALKRLILYKDGFMTVEDELQASKELLMLPKVSSYCTIELKT